ncbi:hypothetical protein GCM10017600_43320 [Streptosporangium carneum]|uniref:Uncharacterized protein n=1 Tax=Streptosporangium carneum TaxID=47481 RepID=A0A9W6I3V4_9ACTN|nr:hypothetical protein GCM10017600_43320 [Streptosporangium carneum]
MRPFHRGCLAYRLGVASSLVPAGSPVYRPTAVSNSVSWLAIRTSDFAETPSRRRLGSRFTIDARHARSIGGAPPTAPPAIGGPPVRLRRGVPWDAGAAGGGAGLVGVGGRRSAR